MPTKRLTQGYIDKIKPASKSFEVRDQVVQNFLVKVSPGGTKTFYAVYLHPITDLKRRYKIGDASAVTLEAAREKALRIFADVSRGIDPQTEKRRKRVSTLEQFLGRDKDHPGPFALWAIENRKYGAGAAERLRKAFQPLLKRRLHELDHWTLERWTAARRKQEVGKSKEDKHPISITTINRDIGGLKAALSMAVKWKLIDTNPLHGFTIAKDHRTEKELRKRYLTPDEESRLFQALDVRSAKMRAERVSGNLWLSDRGMAARLDFRQVAYTDHLEPMIIVALHTGVRRNELFSLEWRDIDFDKRLVLVRAFTSKNQRPRTIPMSDTLYRCLRAWRDQNIGNGLIFVSPKGGKFDNIRKAWGALLKAAKIEGLRWHDLRHSFASRLVQRGVDLYTVKELMGHSTIAMTERYSHGSDEHKVAAVRRLDSNIVDFEQAKSETGGGD